MVYPYKRVTVLAGHYGSGKTNIAVNMAFDLHKYRPRVAIADLDIVNPYFRTGDSREELEKNGIIFIGSEYANTNLDAPALPQELYAITDDRGLSAVMDVGGDDRGALALGRYSPAILEENDYDMLLVVNKFRPLTPDAASAVEIMREIEAAGHLPFTGIINNSNLGRETVPEHVLESAKFAAEVSRLSGLPLRMTAVDRRLFCELSGRVENLFPLDLQHNTDDFMI